MRSARSIRALWLLGLAACAVVFAQTWTRAGRPGGIDLTTYLEATRALAHGGNPYALDLFFPYRYPAFLAFALIPLTFVADGAVLLLWYVASIAALVWTIRKVLCWAYPELRGRPLTPFLALLLIVAFPIVQNNLRNGQVNLIVMALCTFAVGGHIGATGRRAVAWAAAVAIKIAPSILGLFYLRRGRWQAFTLGTVVAVGLCVLPVVVAGTAILVHQREYAAAFVAGSSGAGHPAEPLDFSVGGMLLALPLTIPAFWADAAGALLLVALAAAADWRTRTTQFGDVSAFALYLALIPLVSPTSEVHHLAFALPAVAVVWASVWYGVGPREMAIRWLLYAAALCYGVALLFRPAAGLAFFLSLCALAGATGVCLRTSASARS